MMNQTLMERIIDENIGGILKCDPDKLKELLPYIIINKEDFLNVYFRFSYRKKSLNCNNTNISVVKTIRVHMFGVIKWIKMQETIKVSISISVQLYWSNPTIVKFTCFLSPITYKEWQRMFQDI